MKPGAPRSAILDGGGTVRIRRVGSAGERALVTDDAGRFVLVPAAEIAPLHDENRQGSSVLRERLKGLGLLAPTASREIGAGDLTHHVVLVAHGGRAMSRQVAERVVERVFEGAPSFLQVELRGDDHLADGAPTRFLCEALRARARATSRSLSLVVDVRLPSADLSVMDGVVENGVVLRAHLGARPFDESVRRDVEAIHRRYAASGIDQRSAYVSAVLPLDAAPADRASLLVEMGFSYVEPTLSWSDLGGADPASTISLLAARYETFLREVVGTNARGTLLVDRRAALHLETLTSPLEHVLVPRPLRVAYAPDGTMFPTEEMLPATSVGDVSEGDAHELRRRLLVALPAPSPGEATICRQCVYEARCGAPLLLRALLDGDPGPKQWGGALCVRTMATYDAIFAVLVSPAGPLLRSAFSAWTRARDVVSARLSTI